jgi:hypothetical protein
MLGLLGLLLRFGGWILGGIAALALLKTLGTLGIIAVAAGVGLHFAHTLYFGKTDEVKQRAQWTDARGRRRTSERTVKVPRHPRWHAITHWGRVICWGLAGLILVINLEWPSLLATKPAEAPPGSPASGNALLFLRPPAPPPAPQITLAPATPVPVAPAKATASGKTAASKAKGIEIPETAASEIILTVPGNGEWTQKVNRPAWAWRKFDFHPDRKVQVRYTLKDGSVTPPTTDEPGVIGPNLGYIAGVEYRSLDSNPVTVRITVR